MVGAATPPTPWHLISDVSFPTMEVLQACTGSSGGREALEHAASISSGGAPIIVMTVDD